MTARPQASVRAARSILVLDAHYVRRRAFALASREVGLASVSEAATCETAQRLVSTELFDAMLVAQDEECAGLEFLKALRGGETLWHSEIPVALVLGACTSALLEEIKPLSIVDVIVTPTTVRRILKSIQTLLPDAVQENA